MTTKLSDPLAENKLQDYVLSAAKAAGYEGFGMQGCDLSKPIWWAAYCRQSLDQQTKNNRLPEYLLTLAKMARDQGVIAPIEYILYDHETGEHLERPDMVYLRHELVHKKHILGIMFADIRCLSREPAPQQVFERECEILGIKLLFGDAPSGMDIGSQFVRSAITFSNKMSRLATDRNARAGNIGRVLKGWVPSHKAPYGYVYRRDAEISDGRIRIKKAWWEIDQADRDGNLIKGSPAETVVRIYTWVGHEGRTCYWVARLLNELKIVSPSGGAWTPNLINHIIRNHCYTGKHLYNAKSRVPNPQRPLGDVTGAIRRTIIRPKPAGEAIEYNVPILVSDELWQKANNALNERGRGRGKEGKVIQALLRSRIYCPRCGKPMAVRRRKSSEDTRYYYCRHAEAFSVESCTYRKFVPGVWDEVAWDSIYALLVQDLWIEEKLNGISKQGEEIAGLIKLEQQKIAQFQSKISKVREGYEGGIYSLEETKAKILSYQQIAAKAQQEINRINERSGSMDEVVNVEEVRKELKRLAKANLNGTFSERLDLINKLNLKVYPSEDLKTMRIKCSLLPQYEDKEEHKKECQIVLSGSTGSP